MRRDMNMVPRLSTACSGLAWPCLVCLGRVLNSCSGQLSDRLSDPFCEREAGEIPWACCKLDITKIIIMVPTTLATLAPSTAAWVAKYAQVFSSSPASSCFLFGMSVSQNKCCTSSCEGVAFFKTSPPSSYASAACLPGSSCRPSVPAKWPIIRLVPLVLLAWPPRQFSNTIVLCVIVWFVIIIAAWRTFRVGCAPLSLSLLLSISLSFFISLFLSLSTLHSLQLQHENCHAAIRSRANISYNRVVNTSGSTRRADLAVWDRTTQRSS